MNSPNQLENRATLAVRSGACALTAKAHIRRAIALSSEGRVGIAPIDDLNTAMLAIDRAIKHLDQSRQRLLRKAKRNGDAL
ncbi:hypothetical protein [Rhodanobacter sp. BL-MT-08]